MSKNSKSQAIWRVLSLAGAVAGTVALSATSASAGSCPADQVVPAGKGQPMGATAPEGVTDMVLGSIPLANEIDGMDGRNLRTRLLEIQPGGVVPWHSHQDRPALIYVLRGTITEYSDACAVPIEHTIGTISIESKGLSHWWKNNSDGVVRLLSSDIQHDQMDADTM
ncbi:MAG: cupin domain-containing protein [Dongiaceae bacterium]